MIGIKNITSDNTQDNDARKRFLAKTPNQALPEGIPLG
jgi:hypothetical protein